MKVRHFTVFDAWPVLQRELREGARRPANHRLRFLSAGVGTLLLWIIAANSHSSPAQLGSWLLGGIHTWLLGLIFLVAPALTADCLAREKRDGTLGLLFLTPMSAGGIAAGKALAGVLRAFILWLAVLPILTIPFITGGVAWYDAVTALSLEFCATVLCIAAALLASALTRNRNAAFFLAFFLAALFVILFGQIFQFCLFAGWRGFAGFKNENWWELSAETLNIFSGLTNVRGLAGWSSFNTFSTGFSNVWETLCLVNPPIVLLFFYGIVRFAGSRIEHSWHDKIPSPKRENLLKRYCTPLFAFRFRREMQRTLDWNPIAWLQQYSWKARLGKWGLCLPFLLIEAATGHGPQEVRNFVRSRVDLGGFSPSGPDRGIHYPGKQ